MPSGRRRSNNGHMVILRTPTTLVRSKVSNTPSKVLARYSLSYVFITGKSLGYQYIKSVLVYCVYLSGMSDAREDGKGVWAFGGRENERY